jgi:hypothetical protein
LRNSRSLKIEISLPAKHLIHVDFNNVVVAVVNFYAVFIYPLGQKTFNWWKETKWISNKDPAKWYDFAFYSDNFYPLTLSLGLPSRSVEQYKLCKPWTVLAGSTLTYDMLFKYAYA